VYPHDFHVLGVPLSVWNLTFLIGVLAGYPVFLRAFRRESTGALLARYAVVVYLSALAAKYFAYAFDVHGTFRAPPATSLLSWLFNPVTGPKTLYGVIVLMPSSLQLAFIGSDTPLRRALNLATPAMLVVLATARIGCFLQGCCFGTRSDVFGVSFPPGSPAQGEQVTAGLVPIDAMSMPVVPTQLIEAVFLALLAMWCSWRQRRSNTGSFVAAVCMYSIFRFGVEFFRADLDRGVYGPLATSQWITLAMLAASVLEFRRQSSGSVLVG
jgi:phosphatidylglycerol---prolipoprotein diacylglyceryl transferase